MHTPAVADDYYAILGVSRTADPEAIKAAWRHLARIKHPDKNPGNPNATAEFQLLESAYSTLSDINRRRAYDKLRFATSNSKTNRQRRPAPAAAQPPPPAAPAGNKTPARGNAARARFLEGLRVLRATQEYNLRRARLRLSIISFEHSKLMEGEETDANTYRDNIDNRSWWEMLVANLVSANPQRQQLEEEKARADRRRLDWEMARQIKDEQMVRQIELIGSLEVSLSLTAGEIRRVVQQDAEERERAEQAAAARQKARERQRRRERERWA
ncbi:DnaJ-domain-containing protein [Hypoxylon crocopeplum]|nr:DnaJ-domain-containing protein [Hypoxylon crocopeplum]